MQFNKLDHTSKKITSIKPLGLGFWSPSTSSVDWCEPNYLHVTWMAETWNTITNLSYIILAIIGFKTVYVNAPFKLRLLPTIFLIVGIGSCLFHATLLRSAQLLDELPMLYLISQSCFIVLTIQPNTSTLKKYLLAIFGIFINAAVTMTMVYYPESPEFFFITFGVVTLITFFLALSHCRHYERGTLLWFESAGIFILGFILWNIENMFCHDVEHFKFHCKLFVH
eukprot:gene4746-8328_t